MDEEIIFEHPRLTLTYYPMESAILARQPHLKTKQHFSIFDIKSSFKPFVLFTNFFGFVSR